MYLPSMIETPVHTSDATIPVSPAAPCAGTWATPPRRRVRSRLLILPLCAALLAGCQGAEPAAEGDVPVTREEFVSAVVALREAEREVVLRDNPEERFEERKSEIMETHGVTRDQLRGFLLAHEGDVGYLEAVWDSINERLKHVPLRHDPRQHPESRRFRDR